jgi:RNA polymerase subunit RPABC4/transcription elongation factor Spt4
MPLFGKVFACPNTSCGFDQPLKEGKKCPLCGTEAKAFGLREAVALSASKKTAQKISGGGGGKGGYYCPNSHCTYVTEMRQGEKCPVCGTEAQSDDYQDAGSSVRSEASKEGMLFTDSNTDEEIMKKIHLGLERLGDLDKGSAVFEQNRIIILQNELILRKLDREK